MKWGPLQLNKRVVYLLHFSTERSIPNGMLIFTEILIDMILTRTSVLWPK